MIYKKYQNATKDVVEKKGIIKINYMEVKTPSWFNSSELKDIDISIIVPCYKSKDYIIEHIKSWDLTNHNLKIEIIYVDDHCPQKTHLQCVKSWEERKSELNNPIGKCFLILGNNSGFSNACNTGAKEARGKYLLFLNADTILTKNWLQPIYNSFKIDEKIGIVGNMQLSKNDFIDSCGSEWSWKDHLFFHIGRNIYQSQGIEPFELSSAPAEVIKSKEVKMINGSCLMISKELFDKVCGFDNAYKIGYWEDSDLCMKVVMEGYKIWFCGESKIYHFGGHSGQSNHKYSSENKTLFYNKWIKTKLLNCHLQDSNKLNVNSNNSVVYTSITNKYDSLKNHKQKDIPYVAFLDEYINSKYWNIRSAHKEFSDPNRNAKIHKILSHVYFPDKEFSLWVDGSIKIKFPWSMKSLFETYLSDCDMVVFKHGERDCIYEEAKICCERNLDDINTITKQMERYKRFKVNKNKGLSECSVILRKHNEKVKLFNEIWWEEICQGSRRDQLSFDYSVKKSGVNLKYFPGNLPNNNYFFNREIHGIHTEDSNFCEIKEVITESIFSKFKKSIKRITNVF
jgi:GT2 family glycosyltransferase